MASPEPLSAIATARRILGPDVFKGALSHNARSIVTLILDNLNARPLSNYSALRTFSRQYHGVFYDDIVLCRNAEAVLKYLKNNKKFHNARTPDEEVVATALLQPIYNCEVDIPAARTASFSFSTSRSKTQIYEYVTREFLLDDFSASDLVKLGEIAQKSNLDEIKHQCSRVEAPDKRYIAYLYRVIINAERSETANMSNIQRRMDDSLARLAKTLEATKDTGFRPDFNDDWLRDVEITRAMYDDE